MLFFLLISSLSFFLLLSKSLPLQPFPSWAKEGRLLSFLFVKEFHLLSLNSVKYVFKSMAAKKHASRIETIEDSNEISVLDLPELALECILGKLSPAGLCNMAGVCRSLRQRCRSDYLWERQMREKWGRVIGKTAERNWHKYLNARNEPSICNSVGKPKRLFGSLSRLCSLSWLKFRLDGSRKLKSPLPDDSIMSWYLSLESGKFWFPAQIYNREQGHVGFMLSCYDAELSYDCNTDTFHAKYPPHGRRTIVMEEGVEWDRIRAPPIDTLAHDLHISDCLHDLHPGDHIEIQWRRNKEYPYGWWYGVVGHLQLCDGNEHFCRCHSSETIILEFNQYTPGSRWRQATINRKDHREEGNETDGFYGGIRKLYSKDEISTWRQLWPADILE
ncbi:F-box protein At2g32560 isoform X1 [Dendrobium catenatum]|uniref:F-box protein At2g32560 isoform X1 n=1 Tax=Dendrobium catenatum TaxID=906689 RepID=UPI0009F5CCE6|nr:F-box protein At2g32560 isoform X1 [Dendrobium catenatum]